MPALTRDEVLDAWRSLSQYGHRLLREHHHVSCPIRRPLPVSMVEPEALDVEPISIAQFRYERGQIGYSPERFERVVEINTGIVVMGPRPIRP